MWITNRCTAALFRYFSFPRCSRSADFYSNVGWPNKDESERHVVIHLHIFSHTLIVNTVSTFGCSHARLFCSHFEHFEPQKLTKKLTKGLTLIANYCMKYRFGAIHSSLSKANSTDLYQNWTDLHRRVNKRKTAVYEHHLTNFINFWWLLDKIYEANLQFVAFYW